MKFLVFITLLFANVTWAAQFECTPRGEVKWNKISEGLYWTKYDLEFTPYQKDTRTWSPSQNRKVTIRAFRVDHTKNKFHFHRSTKPLACNPSKDRYIEKLVSDQGGAILGAINANFFEMPQGNIQGVAIDENRIWNANLESQTISSSGIFGIEMGQAFLDTRNSFIQRFGKVISHEDAKNFSLAVQAYPKLLINHELQISDNVLNAKRARTSIGVNEEGNEIVLVTIDAHQENFQSGMSLYEFAHLLKTDKCGVSQKNALNLDGGGSSAFAVPSINLFEQADSCRRLGNILTIQKN